MKLSEEEIEARVAAAQERRKKLVDLRLAALERAPYHGRSAQ
jgi:hypothetical protein